MPLASNSNNVDFVMEAKDISWFIRALSRRRGLIVAMAGFIFMLFVFMLYQLTPYYTATTYVLSTPRQQSVVDLEALLGREGNARGWLDSQIFIIRSDKVLRQLVVSENLTQDVEFNPSLAPPGVIIRLSGLVNDLITDLYAARAVGEPPASPRAATSEPSSKEKTALAIRLLRGKISVAQVSRSHVLGVSLTTLDADKSARLSNRLTAIFVNFQRDNKFEKTRDTIRWLNSRLDELRSELAASEGAVVLFRSRNNLQNPKGVFLGEEELSSLNSQLILLRAEREEKYAKYTNALDVHKRGGDLATVSDVAGSSVIAKLRDEEAELQRREAELATRYGNRHPEIIKARSERRELKRRLEQEIERTIDKLKNDYEVVLSREKSLHQSLSTYKIRIDEINQKSIKLRELMRQAEADRVLYETFLSRYKETERQEELEESDFSILSEARPEKIPSYPNKPLFIQIILAFSLMTSAGVALTLEATSRLFWFGSDLEEVVDLPTLAEVALLPSRMKGKTMPRLEDILVMHPLSLYSEAIRTIRTAVQLASGDKKSKATLITSAIQSEGKTTIALCLARSAAMGGLKTLLIDLDLRRNSLSHIIDPGRKSAGLQKYLCGEVELQDILIQDPKTQLTVVPNHGVVQNPTDIIDSEAMRRFLSTVKQEYDFIIIDASPLMPISDPKLLSHLADVDHIVFVVKWNKTPRDVVLRALGNLEGVRDKVVGIALNAVNIKKQMRGVYSHNRYYYQKYYASYYK